MDPKVGSMIPENLSTKCSIGSMIQSDPLVQFDSRSWIPLDPSVILKKKKKMLKILDFFLEIFQILKIRDSSFVALLILRHFI